MLDTLSSPVAFATAPLGNPNASDVQTSLPNGSAQSRSKTPPSSMSFRSSSLSGDVEVDEPILARFGRRIGMTKENIPGMRHSHKKSTGRRILGRRFWWVVIWRRCACLHLSSFGHPHSFKGDDLSESFLVIPSGLETGVLRKENAALKAELANVQRRLEMTENLLNLREKQDQQLRDSIYQARREVSLCHPYSLCFAHGSLGAKSNG